MARHRIPPNSPGADRLLDTERDGTRYGIPLGRRPDPGGANNGLRPRQLLGWPVGSDRMRHEQPRVRKCADSNQTDGAKTPADSS